MACFKSDSASTINSQNLSQSTELSSWPCIECQDLAVAANFSSCRYISGAHTSSSAFAYDSAYHFPRSTPCSGVYSSPLGWSGIEQISTLASPSPAVIVLYVSKLQG